ncbi:hypothetical protein BD410DRAFT_755116 [Rickenella mellea]|uniref:Uncharacterized protein n=1 Tax=Rickenella mellea TaxID=50990 RepID=A0A4Y7PMU5_9AGAM|nr:hypothetical protein BD410DRAFT_755116 [Rickenella mellea]
MSYARLLDRTFITDRLFDCCSPASIFCIGRTCKIARNAVQFYVKRTFDINDHLHRFVHNPIEFRSMLDRTGAIISGSNALQFLNRKTWPESDLDLYVYKPNYKEVGRWLQDNAGFSYTYRPFHLQAQNFAETDADEPMYENDTICGVFEFRSNEQQDGTHRIIQVIVALKSPMDSILKFHSTVVMNVISARTAYSLYPRATFEESRALVCNPSMDILHDAFRKYAARGYQIIANLSLDDVRSPVCSLRTSTRWADDNMAWTLPLNMEGVVTDRLSDNCPRLEFDPISMNGWEFVVSQFGVASVICDCTYTSVLRYSYTTPSKFLDFLRPIFNGQSRVESDVRRSNLNERYWNWYDFQLPGWRRKFLEDNKITRESLK